MERREVPVDVPGHSCDSITTNILAEIPLTLVSQVFQRRFADEIKKKKENSTANHKATSLHDFVNFDLSDIDDVGSHASRLECIRFFGLSRDILTRI